MLQSGYIITNFPQIVGTPFNIRTSFNRQQIPKRGLRPFNAARIYSLTLDEGPYKQMGIWKSSRFASESSKNLIGSRQLRDQCRAPFNFRW